MSRKLKTLGLALVAVFALSAMVASAASAATMFTSDAESTNVGGSQTTIHKFTSTAGEVTCENATFAGTQVGKTVESVVVSPTYTGCHIIFFGSTISATVNPNGCTYRLYAAGSADINCPEGKSITVTGAGCTITVHAQTGKKSVSYENKESGGIKHINVVANLSGISYTHSGFTCGTGSGTTGTYTGTTTVKGTDTTGKAVNIVAN